MSSFTEQYASDTSGVPAMLDRIAAEIAVARSMVVDPDVLATYKRLSGALTTLASATLLTSLCASLTDIGKAVDALKPAAADFSTTTGDTLADAVPLLAPLSDVSEVEIGAVLGAWTEVKAQVKVKGGGGGGTRTLNPDNPLAQELGFRVVVKRDGKVVAGTSRANGNSLLDATRKALGKSGDAVAASRLHGSDMARTNLRDAIRKVMGGEAEAVDVGYLGLIVVKDEQAGQVAA